MNNCPNDNSPLVPVGLGHKAVLECLANHHVVAMNPEHLFKIGEMYASVPFQHRWHELRVWPGVSAPIIHSKYFCLDCNVQARVEATQKGLVLHVL